MDVSERVERIEADLAALSIQVQAVKEEVERLRSVAGAVSDGPSASDIKQEVNDGPSV